MTKLLKFLIKYLHAAFDDFGFTISASQNSGKLSSGASVTLVSPELELFVSIDNDEIIASFRSLLVAQQSNCYSLAAVFELLGHIDEPGMFEGHDARILRKELPRIINCFSAIEYAETIKRLDIITAELLLKSDVDRTDNPDRINWWH